MKKKEKKALKKYRKIGKAAVAKATQRPSSGMEQLMAREAAKRGKVIEKGTVNGYGQNPSVPSPGNRTQPRDEGGKFVSSSTSGPSEGQPFRPSSDNISTVDTEAARTHGPGSIVQSVLDRGPTPGGRQYRSHTVAGALQEEAMLHQITRFGHLTGTQAAPTSTAQGEPVLVGSEDDGPWVMQSFSQQVQRMVHAFEKACGRSPVWGQPTNADDAAFMTAYYQLREQFWPSGFQDGDNDNGGRGSVS